MNEAVELVRSLKHRYGSAMDCIDGGSRTPEDLETQVIPAVEALAAENIRLRAVMDVARAACDTFGEWWMSDERDESDTNKLTRSMKELLRALTELDVSGDMGGGAVHESETEDLFAVKVIAVEGGQAVEIQEGLAATFAAVRKWLAAAQTMTVERVAPDQIDRTGVMGASGDSR